MANFYNPYHFVEVEAPSSESRKHFWTAKDKLGEDTSLHSRFAPDTHSGRVVVRLHTVTPVAIGAKHPPSGNEPKNIEPYMPGGIPAIPASTLRGMIGTIIETASVAPLRVLTDRPFSYRRKMTESLSAIGLIVKKGEGAAARYSLKPMCLPTLESADGGRSFKAPPGFRHLFPNGPRFKVYFGTREEITDRDFQHRTALGPNQAVPMPVKQLAWNGDKVNLDRTLHVKANRYAVSQIADPRDTAMSGMVRVLGCWPNSRVDQIPHTKKHELWVPVPDPGVPDVPIEQYVIERFEQLADERTDADPALPFEPLESRPNRESDAGFRLRLQTGDMVYFNVDRSGRVTEVSLSSIWRGRVEESGHAATAHRFFEQIDRELLPFCSNRRDQISIAERILGLVEDVPKGEAAPAKSLQLASRLRFADAFAHGVGPSQNLLDPAVTLKILSSPKLPCPVLYFRRREGHAYIQKRDLTLREHLPKGRKLYLHGRSEGSETPWRTVDDTKSRNQKNTVRPLKRGLYLFFHIDYYNLTADELGLLLYALEPDPGFHHKVGMGKPLGLGSVKIEVLGVFPVDRQRRYTLGGLRGRRYEPCWLSAIGREAKQRGAWPMERYQAEEGVADSKEQRIDELRQRVRSAGLVPTEVHNQLVLVGDWANAPEADQVRYPTTGDQRDPESEHFKWFVFNDGHRERGRGMSPKEQFLKPLRGAKKLPTLSETDWERTTGRKW